MSIMKLLRALILAFAATAMAISITTDGTILHSANAAALTWNGTDPALNVTDSAFGVELISEQDRYYVSSHVPVIAIYLLT